MLGASEPALERGARYPRPPRELSLRDPCAVAGGHEVSYRADGERTGRLSAANGQELRERRKVGTFGGRGVVGVEHAW